jgi:hypothetical protein
MAVPLNGGVPQFLTSEPDSQRDPELHRLWVGLGQRFGTEIGGSTS